MNNFQYHERIICLKTLIKVYYLENKHVCTTFFSIIKFFYLLHFDTKLKKKISIQINTVNIIVNSSIFTTEKNTKNQLQTE